MQPRVPGIELGAGVVSSFWDQPKLFMCRGAGARRPPHRRLHSFIHAAGATTASAWGSMHAKAWHLVVRRPHYVAMPCCHHAIITDFEHAGSAALAASRGAIDSEVHGFRWPGHARWQRRQRSFALDTTTVATSDVAALLLPCSLSRADCNRGCRFGTTTSG